MNIAIEYLVRNKRTRNLLHIPCSLFLNTETDRKLVVTIKNHYGPGELTVKHWLLWEATSEDRFPKFIEYKVKKEDVFTSEHVVVPKCKLLRFEESPYPSGTKQHSDFPHSTEEQQEYEDCIVNFYNPPVHNQKRTNWLWQAFSDQCVPEDLKFDIGQTSKSFDLQREIIQFYSKPLWHTWIYWKRHLLDFPGPAAELVFHAEYNQGIPSTNVPKRSFTMWGNTVYDTHGYYVGGQIGNFEF